MAYSPHQSEENQNEDISGIQHTRIVATPGLHDVYVPGCDSNLKPFEGQKFTSLDEGIKFYRRYAATRGFDVRLGTSRKAKDKIEMMRYVYCNKEGEKNVKVDDDNDGLNGQKHKRHRVSTRVACKARVSFKFAARHGYVIKQFIEHHTHSLVSDPFKKYLKGNRHLDFLHQQFILNCARVNLGPMKSYKLFKETVGQFSNVGCTSGDFLNFSRDLKVYVDGVDAQMSLDKLFMKREQCSGFYFDYGVDEKDHLTRVFWADPISKKKLLNFQRRRFA